MMIGRHCGAPFITGGLRGFSGWTPRPGWMPGGWEFYSPWIGTGRLYTDCGRYLQVRVLLPAKLVRLWRMRSSEYRRFMREELRAGE